MPPRLLIDAGGFIVLQDKGPIEAYPLLPYIPKGVLARDWHDRGELISLVRAPWLNGAPTALTDPPGVFTGTLWGVAGD